MDFRIACGRGDLEVMITMLLQDPSLVHSKGYHGWTGLFYATRAEDVLAVKLLLLCGSDISIRDLSGQTVLDIAKKKQYYDIVKLIENADVSHV